MAVLSEYPVTGVVEGHVGPPDGKTIEEAFWEFHKENPGVYTSLVQMTRQLTSRGVQRVGIKMLFEVMRWRHALKTSSMDDFKLNNNYHSYYARLIMTNESDLVGVFETRRLHVQGEQEKRDESWKD